MIRYATTRCRLGDQPLELRQFVSTRGSLAPDHGTSESVMAFGNPGSDADIGGEQRTDSHSPPTHASILTRGWVFILLALGAFVVSSIGPPTVVATRSALPL